MSVVTRPDNWDKMTRLEKIEFNNPKQGKIIREQLAKIKENRESSENPESTREPSMALTKDKLLEIAKMKDIEVGRGWTKQEILVAIVDA
jgi:hypothetical protein